MKILASAEMASVDRAAQRRAGAPPLLLMERAAEGIVELFGREYPGAARVVVVCGPGNNGGDGLAAARLLKRRGVAVDVFLLGRSRSARGPSRLQLTMARSEAIAPAELTSRAGVAALQRALSRADVVIDGLFGTGLSRPLTGLAALAVNAINAAGRPVIAIDIPSGLSGDSGLIAGPTVHAHATGAIAALKHCHVFFPAQEQCGQIVVVDIGIPDELLEIPKHRFAEISAVDIAPLFSPRPPNSYKETFGHVLIVAGSRGKAGAAVLAAAGALRAGAGLVTIGVPESLESRFAAALPEAMTLPLPESDGALGHAAGRVAAAFLRRCDSGVIGPGLGVAPPTVGAIEDLVRLSPVPLVVDADALNAFGGRLPALSRRRSPVVLTPHPGEASRLLGSTTGRIQSDRLGAVRTLARESRSVAVLKGAGTLTADPAGRAWHNPTGCPALATAGSGDVLAGVIAALLAGPNEPVDAAIAGVFIHGLAGERAALTVGSRGVLASEVAGALPAVIDAFV